MHCMERIDRVFKSIIQSQQKKYLYYFLVSLGFVILASIAIYFRKYHFENPEFIAAFLHGEKTLIRSALYFLNVIVLFFSFFVVLCFCITGSLKARLIWLAIVFELLYFAVNSSLSSFVLGYFPKDYAELRNSSDLIDGSYFNFMQSGFFDWVSYLMLSLLIASFVFGVLSLDAKTIKAKFSENTPVKTYAVILLLLVFIFIRARVLPLRWDEIGLFQYYSRYPRILNLFYSQSLIAVLCVMVFASFSLFYKRTSGYILIPILLTYSLFRFFALYQFIHQLDKEPWDIEVNRCIHFFERHVADPLRLFFIFCVFIFLILFYLVYLKEGDFDRRIEEKIEKGKLKMKDNIKIIIHGRDLE